MEEFESYGLEYIQSLLLIVLVTFDELCRKNNISYSLHGGTLLGAVRNHKFIPWDDDIDVSMRREDYERFKRVAGTLPSNFKLDDESTWVPRLVMAEGSNVVCLDILIWDFISSEKSKQGRKFLIEHFIQGTLKKKVDYRNYNGFNKCLIFITSIIGKLIPYEIKLKQYNYICENYCSGDRKCMHRSNDNYESLCHVFDAHYMDEYEDIMFENRRFMVNKRHVEFLIRSYGRDYLTPPSMEERIPQHEEIRNNICLR